MKRFSVWFLLSLFLLPGIAMAHTRSESHSTWSIDRALINANFTVADKEAERITANGLPPTDAQLLTYLSGRVGVESDAKPCPASAPPHVLSAAPGFRRVEFQFTCPTVKKLSVYSHAFFERTPTHIHFATIEKPNGEFDEAVLTASSQKIDLSELSGDRFSNAGFLDFVRMGIMHIFTGVDHMSFLLGLVLISRRLRDLIFVVTGFTLGHSLTLALAVTGIIRPHAEYIDALVALTIALIGMENVAVASRKPGIVAAMAGSGLLILAGLRFAGIGLLPPLLLIGASLFSANYLMVSGHLRDAGRLRLVITLIFGLIHGFGFAADLLESRLPPAKLGQILFGFNLGVEIGQLCIVLLITGTVLLLSKLKFTLPRPIVVDLTAMVLVAIGTSWFITRTLP